VHRRATWALLLSLTLAQASPAAAFCGFYAGSATGELTASASRVVLLRDGTRTVLTMQNRYEGPPEDFALVVPVPVVLGPRDVRALDPGIFDRLDALTAPRVVEYWEREPTCPDPRFAGMSARVPMIRAGMASSVTVEAEFTTAEYDIVILSATDSAALETWLHDNHYRVPEGAADALRPYVEAGTRFFVARVDTRRVRFEDGRAVLSPLRVVYDAPELALPVRLGVLNSRGTQDLVVYVIAQGRRYEIANREGIFAPTNVEVREIAIPRFAEFYEALFDRAMERHPDAVMTEYAWQASSCDPCPSPPVSVEDLNDLGGDMTSSARTERLGEPEVAVRVRRRSGRGSSEAGLREAVERRLAAIRTCIAASGPGVTYALEATVHRGGLLELPAAERDRPGTIRCIARRLQRARVDAPPLRLDDSRWEIELAIDRAEVRRVWSASGFTLTRLRTRTRKDGRIDDLVFREAPAIVGGRGMPDAQAHLDPSITRAHESTFQSRFVVLHRSDTRVSCAHPLHGGWSGASAEHRRRRPSPGASDGSVESLLRTPIPELGLVPASMRAGRPQPHAGPPGRTVPRGHATPIAMMWARRSRERRRRL
jgi:hypothetical protein